MRKQGERKQLKIQGNKDVGLAKTRRLIR